MARTASPVATASTATSCCSKPPPWQPWQTRMSSRALQRVSHGVSLIEVLVVVGLMALALALFSGVLGGGLDRSEEHTSELQSLMRISYAVFCLKKKK